MKSKLLIFSLLALTLSSAQAQKAQPILIETREPSLTIETEYKTTIILNPQKK